MAFRVHASTAFFAEQDLSLARQKGADVDLYVLEDIAGKKDKLKNSRVLGLTPGTKDTADSLSR